MRVVSHQRRSGTGVLALAVAFVFLVAACSGSTNQGPPSAVTKGTVAATTTAARAAGVTLRMRALPARTVAVGTARRDVKADRATRRLVRNYLQYAVVDALRRGRPSKALRTLFTPGAARRAVGRDARVVADGGYGPPRSPATVTGTLRFTTLRGGDGLAAAVSATLYTRVTVQGPNRRLVLARKGELVLMPVFGQWRIAGYHLTVTRRDLTAGTTTTTRATSAPPTSGGAP